MYKFAVLAGAAVIALATNLWTATSEAAPRREKVAAAKPEVYVVVQIGDEVSVVRKTELTTLKKSTTEDDARKKKEYSEAKKAAVKSKDKTDLGKPPVKRSVRVLKEFKSQEEANSFAEKRKEGKDTGTKTAKKTTPQ
jgi:hypothetical protein